MTQSTGYRFVQFLQHQSGVAHAACIAGDAGHHLGVVQVLQSPAVVLRGGRGAREHQHTGTGHMRIGNAGDGVGHTRSCGHQCHTQAVRQFGFCMGHVNSGTFIAHIDETDAVGVQAHPNRHDVTAAQSIDPFNALADQKPGDQVGNRMFNRRSCLHGFPFGKN